MQTNTKQIKQHLEYITKRWDELDGDSQFEIRCIRDGHIKSKKFNVQQIDDAVVFAKQINQEQYNVYTTVNPVNKRANGKHASDEDIIGSFFVYADCDDPQSMENVRKDIKSGFTETFAVHTGKLPPRGHIYYELEQPVTDMKEWRELQKAISTKFKSDEKICNPSRIMRLAGSVSYPDAAKKAKGRVTELTELLKNKRVLKTTQALKTNFPTHSTLDKFQINFQGYTQNDRIDIQNSINHIRQNIDWHDNMIKVVASMVTRGRQDYEIHQALVGITQPGYTNEQTTKEIDIAIEGARNKGYDRNNYQQQQVQIVQPLNRKLFKKWTPIDPLSIKPRDFLYGKHYIRNYASLTVAPPGVGKSALVIAEAISMATGRDLLNVSTKQCKVAYFNAEDPIDEIQNRVLAIGQHYDIRQEDLANLYIASGREDEILLLQGEYGIVNDDAFMAIEEMVKAESIDVLILDPLANMTTSSESVENFRTIGRSLSMLADRCDMSIMIVHHTRKIAPGQHDISVEDARGGSSLIGAVRSARIINRMSKTEGENHNVDNYLDYFKIDAAGKNNLARLNDKAKWYKKTSQTMANNDEIVVVEEFVLPSAFDGITEHQVRDLVKAIGKTDIILLSSNRATRNENKMSIHEFIAEELDLNIDDAHAKRRVSLMLKSWLENDVLREETINMYDIDPKTYRKRDVLKHIVVGEAKIW